MIGVIISIIITFFLTGALRAQTTPGRIYKNVACSTGFSPGTSPLPVSIPIIISTPFAFRFPAQLNIIQINYNAKFKT